jgi:transposase
MTRRAQPPYPSELRERAVRMVAEIVGDYDSPWAAMNAVAEKLGVGTGETVRKWVRQAEIDGGTRSGTTSEESEELKRLRRENSELRRANDILKAASAFFAAEIDRPQRRS